MNPFWTNLVIDFLLVLYVLDCAFMGLVIMMQRSKQEGLGATFGGSVTESVFGAQASNVLVKATVWAAVIFFVVSMVLARLYAHREAMGTEGTTLQELDKPTARALTVPVPAPSTSPMNAAGQPVVPTATPMIAPAPPVKPSSFPASPASTVSPIPSSSQHPVTVPLSAPAGHPTTSPSH